MRDRASYLRPHMYMQLSKVRTYGSLDLPGYITSVSSVTACKMLGDLGGGDLLICEPWRPHRLYAV